MRRTLLMIMAVALLLTQCRKPAVEFPTAEPANTVSMTITAGPGGKTDISETGGITWSAGDRIYVGHDGTYVGYLTLVSGQNTPTGTFTGNVTLPNSTTGEQTFHFFYLGSGSQTLTAGESTQATVSFASQTGLRGGLGSCHVGHGSAKGAVSAGGVTGISVMMKSEVALSRFSFKKSGTSEGYSGALTLSGDRIYNSMTVGFGGTFSGTKTGEGKINLTDATSSEKYVMLVPAGAGSATLKFDAGAGTTDCNLANGIEANKYYGQGGAIEVTVKVPVPVTGVTLNKTELSLEVGATETLVPAVLPADATNKNVTWGSSDESVATVADGTVTAVAAGTATIRVTTVDGEKTAECAVTVTPAYEYVDLGLSVKWATCNLGAEHPYDYGNYYAWGETAGYNEAMVGDGASSGASYSPGTVKTNYGWDYYKWGSGSTNLGKYVDKAGYGMTPPDNKTVLDAEDDAARAVWGGDWRTPTADEFTELKNNTTRTWKAAGASITIAGQVVSMPVAGSYCVSKKSGYTDKYIFLPAAGNRSGTTYYDEGTGGSYMLSSLSQSTPSECIYIYMSASLFATYTTGRVYGWTVRPVRQPQN